MDSGGLARLSKFRRPRTEARFGSLQDQINIRILHSGSKKPGFAGSLSLCAHVYVVCRGPLLACRRSGPCTTFARGPCFSMLLSQLLLRIERNRNTQHSEIK